MCPGSWDPRRCAAPAWFRFRAEFRHVGADHHLPRGQVQVLDELDDGVLVARGRQDHQGVARYTGTMRTLPTRLVLLPLVLELLLPELELPQ